MTGETNEYILRSGMVLLSRIFAVCWPALSAPTNSERRQRWICRKKEEGVYPELILGVAGRLQLRSSLSLTHGPSGRDRKAPRRALALRLLAGSGLLALLLSQSRRYAQSKAWFPRRGGLERLNSTCSSANFRTKEVFRPIWH